MIDIPNGVANAPGYNPSIITIVIGVNNTVVWKNDDAGYHSATPLQVGRDWNGSGTIIPGTTYTHTFETPEAFDYLCDFHSFMIGEIYIVAAIPAPQFPAAYLALVLLMVIAAAAIELRRFSPSSALPPT